MADNLPQPELGDLVQVSEDPGSSAMEGRSKSGVPLWAALPLMVVGLVLAALILSRVAGPLYDLLFPDALPVPGGSHEVAHVRPDKGTEYWIYRTSKSGNEVAQYYVDEGGTCRYTARTAPGEIPDESAQGEHSVARCVGESEGGAGGFSWEVYIAEGYSPEEGPTLFRIYRFG